MRRTRKTPVRKTPVIVTSHGRIVSVMGIKHYHVVDLDDLEENTCPICGTQGLQRSYCTECNINWAYPEASLREIHETVNKVYPPSP